MWPFNKFFDWIGNHAKHFISGIWAIPVMWKNAVVGFANFWIGIFVIGIIFVLWKKYKK